MESQQFEGCLGKTIRRERSRSFALGRNVGAFALLFALVSLCGCASLNLPGHSGARAGASAETDSPAGFSQAAIDAAMKSAAEQGRWTALVGLSGTPDDLPTPTRVPAGAPWPLSSQDAVATAQRQAGEVFAAQDDGWQEKMAGIISPLPADIQFKPTAQVAERCPSKTERPAAIIKMTTLRKGKPQAQSAAWRMDCAGDTPPPGVITGDQGEALWLGETRRDREDGLVGGSHGARKFGGKAGKANMGVATVVADEKGGSKVDKLPAASDDAVAEDQAGEGSGSNSPSRKNAEQGVEVVQVANLTATGPAWMWAQWRGKTIAGDEGDWQRAWFWFTPASASLSSQGAPNAKALEQWAPAAEGQ